MCYSPSWESIDLLISKQETVNIVYLPYPFKDGMILPQSNGLLRYRLSFTVLCRPFTQTRQLFACFFLFIYHLPLFRFIPLVSIKLSRLTFFIICPCDFNYSFWFWIWVSLSFQFSSKLSPCLCILLRIFSALAYRRINFFLGKESVKHLLPYTMIYMI